MSTMTSDSGSQATSNSMPESERKDIGKLYISCTYVYLNLYAYTYVHIVFLYYIQQGSI